MQLRLGRPSRSGLVFLLVFVFVLLPLAAARAAPYAALVMDARTGQVIHATNADTRLHPASLTKMMTLYLAFEAMEHGEISQDTPVKISAHAAAEPPSKLGLKAGQTIRFRYLIRAAAIKSANDAATAIGEALDGSEAAFARRMNRKAKQLGMTRTTFKNANGLTEEGHLSTARDMTILGRHLLYDYPEYYNLFSRTSADTGMGTVYNTNRKLLAAYKGADGIKTGYTRAAGFNLVASAERGNKRVIATMFGGTSGAARNARVAELLDMGFSGAPAVVAKVQPAKPAYDAPAEAVAAAVAKPARTPPTPERSPRPPANPRRGAVALALAEAPAAVAPVTAAATAGAVALALTEPATPIVPPVDTAATNAAVSIALMSAPDAAPAEEEDVAAALTEALELAAPAAADVTALRPRARPLAAVTADPVAAEAAVPADTAPVELAAAEVGEAEFLAGDAAEGEVIALRTDAEDPAPGTIALVAAEPEPEVVTRFSTSGGRHWSINVGRYASKYEAERVLLQTALGEIETLDEALRKVVRKPTGFEANFVGLSEGQAHLACARLTARNRDCTAIGPG